MCFDPISARARSSNGIRVICSVLVLASAISALPVPRVGKSEVAAIGEQSQGVDLQLVAHGKCDGKSAKLKQNDCLAFKKFLKAAIRPQVAKTLGFPVTKAATDPCGTEFRVLKSGEDVTFNITCAKRFDPYLFDHVLQITKIVVRDQGNYERKRKTLLGGPIPATALAELEAVTDLDLAYNNFNGVPFPKAMGRLKMLKHLNLGVNKLSGSVDADVLGQLADLEWMSVDENDLVGLLPEAAFPKLTKMRQIYLGANRFTGTIPSTIGAMRDLDWFNVHDDRLSGTVPHEIKHLKKLTSLGLEHNMLVGKVPDLPFSRYTAYCNFENNAGLNCPSAAAKNGCCSNKDDDGKNKGSSKDDDDDDDNDDDDDDDDDNDVELGRSSDESFAHKTALRSVRFLGKIKPPACVKDTSPFVKSSWRRWVVNDLPGGGFPRCYSAVAPARPKRKLPVVIWFDGVGCSLGRVGPEDDRRKGTKSMAELAVDAKPRSWCRNTTKCSPWGTGGFALVAPEPLRFAGGTKAHKHTTCMWDIPQPLNAKSGMKCAKSRDYALMLGVIKDLKARPEMDMDHVYLLGESLGADAAAFWSICLRESNALGSHALRSFGMHSSGLKIRGDGNDQDPLPSKPKYSYGECKHCKYYPVVPSKQPGLKACLFASPYDEETKKRGGDTIAEQFADHWKRAGNPAQLVLHKNPRVGKKSPDQHCFWLSYSEMLSCLDNGSRTLIQPEPQSDDDDADDHKDDTDDDDDENDQR